jgi:predicted Ser/Thr protein kinase
MLKRYKNFLLVFLKGKRDHLSASTAAASRLVPAVVRKPSVIWRWVLASHGFYISVIIVLILMNTAVPSAVDTTLSKIYPQIETKKLFGLIVQKSENPKILAHRKTILGFFWVAGFGLSSYVLLLCLPGVVRKTTMKARLNEARADTMLTVKPSESILLYNKALKLAVDQAHESTLKSKIDSLDNIIKTGNIERAPLNSTTIPKSQGTGTIVLPKEDHSRNSKQGNTIGPDGRYRIERKLGHGAMGIVFLARDQLLFRDVALKKLTPGLDQDQNVITRFQQEARALAQLSHPNIVQIYDLVQQDNQYWIAMEYVEGNDLGSLIESKGKYPLQDTLQIGIRIAEAMDYAHRRGVVHRDFKPSNVLITLEGQPKVMDFGLAKLSHSSLATMEGSLLGSPAFMSPEQARGETADTRSDIYAMGVALYQLITGKLPFEGELKSVLTQKIVGHQPSMEPLEDRLPADLVHLIKKMMATNPEDRPATMEAVKHVLKHIRKSDS